MQYENRAGQASPQNEESHERLQLGSLHPHKLALLYDEIRFSWLSHAHPNTVRLTVKLAYRLFMRELGQLERLQHESFALQASDVNVRQQPFQLQRWTLKKTLCCRREPIEMGSLTFHHCSLTKGFKWEATEATVKFLKNRFGVVSIA